MYNPLRSSGKSHRLNLPQNIRCEKFRSGLLEIWTAATVENKAHRFASFSCAYFLADVLLSLSERWVDEMVESRDKNEVL